MVNFIDDKISNKTVLLSRDSENHFRWLETYIFLKINFAILNQFWKRTLLIRIENWKLIKNSKRNGISMIPFSFDYVSSVIESFLAKQVWWLSCSRFVVFVFWFSNFEHSNRQHIKRTYRQLVFLVLFLKNLTFGYFVAHLHLHWRFHLIFFRKTERWTFKKKLPGEIY